MTIASIAGIRAIIALWKWATYKNGAIDAIDASRDMQLSLSGWKAIRGTTLTLGTVCALQDETTVDAIKLINGQTRPDRSPLPNGEMRELVAI